MIEDQAAARQAGTTTGPPNGAGGVDEADPEATSSPLVLFEQFGEPRPVSGNAPLFLDDPDSVWLVAGATMHLFLSTTVDGVERKPAPIFDATPGTVLFGIAPVIDGQTRTVISASGTASSQVIRLDRAMLIADGTPAAMRQATRLAERWCALLQASVRPPYGPQTAGALAGPEPVVLEAGASALAFERSVWFRVTVGAVALLDQPAFVADPGTGLAFAAVGSWVRTTDGATVTFDAEPDIDAVWETVGQTTRQALLITMAQTLDQTAERRNRLLDAADAETVGTDQAFRDILDVFSQGDQSVPLSAQRFSDPLLAVCQIIGDATGLRVVAPADQLDSVADPLRSVARASRFRTRDVQLDGEWWRTADSALLGWLAEDGRPVALIPRSSSVYRLVDPIDHTAIDVDSQVASRLRPVAQMLYRSFPSQVMDARSLLRFGFAGTRRDLITVLVLGLIGGLLGVATPVATGLLVDSVIPEDDRFQLFQLSLALMAAALATAAFTITRNLALLRAEGRADTTTQSAVWDRLLSLPTDFFRGYTAGDLGTRAMGIDRIRQSVTDIATTAVLGFIFSLWSLGLQFTIDPQLSLISIAVLAVVVGLTVLTSRQQIRLQREMQEVGGTLTSMILQFLNGIPKLRVAAAENRAFAVWARWFSRQSALGRDNQMIQLRLIVLFAVLQPLATLFLFGFFTFQDLSDVSTGEFLTFYAAFGQVLAAAIAMSGAIGSLTMVIPMFERARPILETLPESDEVKVDPGQLRGEIEVSNVSFAYNEGDPPVLSDVSFSVRPGQFVAFVGPSGAGKSTLLRLLLGFDAPTAGSIAYDGQNIGTIDMLSVRRQLGVVLQNGTVMPGELGSNIIGASQRTLDDAWVAARMAGLDEDINAMPMGMHTYIMEGGTTLSGGQRQRLMIARAVINRPRILFFDEATSALDNRTQAVVSQSLEQLNSTRLVIAHRLSTIIKADQIHVMVAGRIVQSGTYDELMANDGPFHDLARRQLI